ncbi:MAG: bifunctional glutamate N-acetyltransferase/amino-acid acetyltransferase ArgJ [Pirellulaceae bacterium]|nr:bifunctional glutamate N-acetyltransferase/amino-acid acetyltransferase ArgJ [Pirellulaceae bacterium]
MQRQIPEGFELAGVHCGIKPDASRLDLTLIRCQRPAVGVGVYTQNLFHAAPVALDRQRTPSDRIAAVVINSGNANACTGPRGMSDAEEMARLAADACGCQPDQVLVMSTGIIGRYLPLERIAAGVQAAAAELSREPRAIEAAARGMMTTDKGPKIASRTIELDDGPVQLLGLAKGAAMIGPRMATMLAVFLCDANLNASDAQATLEGAVNDSFNCISVEGHMSTNDTVLLLASGARGGAPLAGPQLSAVQIGVRELAIELARMIPDDGEGSTHLIEIEVSGCRNRDEAFQIARSVASSALVKTAIAGGDPNWGRIVSAAGYAGVAFDPQHVELFVNGIALFRKGSPLPFDERAVSRAISGQRDTLIQLGFGEGDAVVRFWTSDLTVDYVRFNADYST